MSSPPNWERQGGENKNSQEDVQMWQNEISECVIKRASYGFSLENAENISFLLLRLAKIQDLVEFSRVLEILRCLLKANFKLLLPVHHGCDASLVIPAEGSFEQRVRDLSPHAIFCAVPFAGTGLLLL